MIAKELLGVVSRRITPCNFHTKNCQFVSLKEWSIFAFGSCVCDQCPGEDEHVQNEVHALLICQDHRVCELKKHFSFLFSPFFEDFSAAQPFLLQQNNRLCLFLSLWIYLWLAETSQQPISQTTWLKVTPIVTIVTIGGCGWSNVG